MGSHDVPDDVGRNMLEELGLIALEVRAPFLDLFARWRHCHDCSHSMCCSENGKISKEKRCWTWSQAPRFVDMSRWATHGYRLRYIRDLFCVRQASTAMGRTRVTLGHK